MAVVRDGAGVAQPHMSKTKATKMALAKLRFGHFGDINTGRKWTFCPECEAEVSVDRQYGVRSEAARERALREALIAHLMDPYHDEED